MINSPEVGKIRSAKKELLQCAPLLKFNSIFDVYQCDLKPCLMLKRFSYIGETGQVHSLEKE